MKARIAFRVLIGAGLLLAWAGLALPWQTWTAETRSSTAIGADGSLGGFAESRPFWIVLAVATLLAAVALLWHKRWAFAALGAAALGLIGLAVWEIDASLAVTSAFLTVAPGVGVVLSLAGAVALLAGVVVALRPRGIRLAGAVAATGLAVGLALAWPQDDGRPTDGAIAELLDDSGQAMAFDGDTLYRLDDGVALAEPAPGREYDAVTLWDYAWSQEQPRFRGAPGRGIAFADGALFVALGGLDRLISITPDGEYRMLVARPPVRRRDEPVIPAGQSPQLDDDFYAGAIAAAPDGSLYMLRPDGVARWSDGRLTTVAGRRRSGFGGDGGPARRARFDGPRDLATDARGAVYVADTGNGRVRRIDPDGTIDTVVGTDAAPGCVGRGLDDPLALDLRRCTAVRALAVDDAGNLYLALRSLAMIVGVTPEGEVSVVAGTGPKGWADGDGRAAHARLGLVDGLEVGPDGDLYVSESGPRERVRRIADPAGILSAPRGEPDPPEPAPACEEIADLMEATVDVARPRALERSLEALAAVAPEAIHDDVQEIAGGADRTEVLVEISFAMKPGEGAVSLGDYAEKECGLVGGFDVPVEQANEFCVAYARYLDQGAVARPGAEPPRALDDVVSASPPFLAATGRAAIRDLSGAAGRAVPEPEAVQLSAGIEAIGTVASAMCALR